MKISKLFAITLHLKSRLILFTVLFAYNMFLGFYLRGFFILAPTFLVFYLLSVLPTLFLLMKVKPKRMRAIIYFVLSLDICMNGAYAFYCVRILPIMTVILLVVELPFFIVSADKSGKDKILTKSCALRILAMIFATLLSACFFVYKQDDIPLANGRATLWDTQTEKLADEICEDCDTDAKKVMAIYDWIIHSFEYDHEYDPAIQYFDVRKTLNTHKGVCYDFAHLFAALCRSQNIPCYVIAGTSYSDNSKHVWNRVYFGGSWWNLDVTNDMNQLQKQGQLYGFYPIENIDSPDNDYWTGSIY